MEENPTMENTQATAIAYSMCREGTAQNGPGGNGDGDGGSPNSGIKSRLKILNAGYKTHNGKQGTWINAKGQNIFVAKNQSIEKAVEAQCGCAKLGSAGKISKEKADYHKTDSETKNCHTCRFYKERIDYCEVVEGNIQPYFVSDLWQPKK